MAILRLSISLNFTINAIELKVLDRFVGKTPWGVLIDLMAILHMSTPLGVTINMFNHLPVIMIVLLLDNIVLLA